MKFLLKILLRILLPILILFMLYLFFANGNKLPGVWKSNDGNTILQFQNDGFGVATSQQSRGIAGIRFDDEIQAAPFDWKVTLGELKITMQTAGEPQSARFLIFGDTMFFLSNWKLTILKRQS